MNTNGFGPVSCGTIIKVKGLRKDGKYTCQYLFQSTGRTIGKLMTLDEINAAKEHATVYFIGK